MNPRYYVIKFPGSGVRDISAQYVGPNDSLVEDIDEATIFDRELGLARMAENPYAKGESGYYAELTPIRPVEA